ncbi:type I polyketide synthase, partial [Streptomyces sp. MUSC 14]|uniref:type I polyketide synthase n=1 Tax=Streptomyces sp. MUSC 14 TaxID=1354889 RepID=UPI000A728B28
MTEQEPIPTDDPGRPVAVIGLSCRFPMAPGPEPFWHLLRDGRHAIRPAPDGRRPPATASTPAWGGFLDDVDTFDPAFFGMSPREAAAVDPQQRLMLELGWEALEHAGIVPETLRGTGLGVFAGGFSDDYAHLVHRNGTDAATRHTMAGTKRAFLANRLSHFLGAHGPSISVDSAQSSSLVAVHLACQSLRAGECDIAMAGGVSLNLASESTVIADRWGPLSPDGRCFTFDARANGYVPGEGGGVVVLKTLADALADGDTVHCVIRGSAVNHGGGSDPTVPSAPAQEDVLRRAYAHAGVDAGDLQYVELHGTGTRAGDPVEATALGTALGAGRPAEQPLVVGSVKTNLGHLGAAAGIAGLIKTILCIEHRQIPASLNFETPNPEIPFDRLNLRVQREFGTWSRPDRPLIAGVSSFGMGGTNCHVVLGEAPHAAPAAEAAQPVERVGSVGVLPFVVSGRTEDGLRGQVERLRSWVLAHAEVNLADVAWSLATSRAALDHRAVVAAGGRDELLSGLEVLSGAGSVREGRLAFVFTGQGAQRRGMGRELYEVFPVFARAFDAVCEQFGPGVGEAIV